MADSTAVTVENHPETENLREEPAVVEREEEAAKMAETEQALHVSPPEKPSFSIWPPTQKTREAVAARLAETLSAPSILSKRYGTMSRAEAEETARRIEAEAFDAAGGADVDQDGIEILQVYSRDISKRMLEAVKSRSASAVSSTEVASAEEGVASAESEA